MIWNENLIGRYLKAKYDDAYGVKILKGEYIEITGKLEGNTPNSDITWHWSESNFDDFWELMPERFTPYAKWYHNTDWSNKKDYLKGIIDGSAIKGNETILAGTYNKYSTSWSYNSSRTSEVPISEIQEFLPEGHPDKLSVPLVNATTVTTEAELYVEIIKSGSYGGVVYTEGEIWKVVKFDAACDYLVSGIHIEKDGKETQVNLIECKPVKTARFESETKYDPLSFEPEVPTSWIPKKDMWIVMTSDYAYIKKDGVYQLDYCQGNTNSILGSCWYLKGTTAAPYIGMMRPATDTEVGKELRAKQIEEKLPEPKLEPVQPKHEYKPGEWVIFIENDSPFMKGDIAQLKRICTGKLWHVGNSLGLENKFDFYAFEHNVTGMSSPLDKERKESKLQIPKAYEAIQVKQNKNKFKLQIK